MNNSTGTTYFEQIKGRHIYIIILPFAAILICVSNIIVIIVSKKIRKTGDTSYKFIINLAILELLVGVAIGQGLIFDTFAIAHESRIRCFYQIQSLTLLTSASQFMVTATSLDRYLIICHYTTYLKLHKKRFGYLTIALAWIIPFIICVLPLAGMYKFNGQSICLYITIFHKEIYLTRAIILAIIISTNLVLYATIFRKAHQHIRRLGIATHDNTENSRQSGIMLKKLRTAKITGFVTLAFIVFWVPLDVVLFRYGTGVRGESIHHFRSTYILGISKYFVNPFIYGWQKRAFREKCAELFKCKIK